MKSFKQIRRTKTFLHCVDKKDLKMDHTYSFHSILNVCVCVIRFDFNYGKIIHMLCVMTQVYCFCIRTFVVCKDVLICMYEKVFNGFLLICIVLFEVLDEELLPIPLLLIELALFERHLFESF